MLKSKYITPKNHTKPQPWSFTLNIRQITADVDRAPATSQGLNLPYLDRVRSMILPMMGSFSASNTRAAIIMPVTAASWAASSERVNSTKVSR